MKMFFVFFFFSSRRRHTRFDCDWSSDVCSSDLDRGALVELNRREGAIQIGPVGGHAGAAQIGSLPNTSVIANVETVGATESDGVEIGMDKSAAVNLAN